MANPATAAVFNTDLFVGLNRPCRAIDTECVGALLGLLSVPVFLALIGPCRCRIAQAGRGGGGGERMWCLPGSANSPDSTDRRTMGVKW
jgi:hypothetical protein